MPDETAGIPTDAAPIINPNPSPIPIEEPYMEPAPKTKKPYLLIIAPLLLIVLIVLYLVFRTQINDLFLGIGYNPTPDMSAVRDSLQLTADGTRIFNATHPLLASRDDFNASCESHDEAVSVLGCYTGDRVYVYNIEDETLSGIRESTTAHEFLHAVWSRLTGLERSELVPALESVYSAHADDLKETIDAYPNEERIGELYVRSATQIADLPEILEKHYAKFFRDQDAIAAFYASYIAPFNEIKEQITKLKSELDALEKEINDKSAALDARSAAFSATVSEFNACAEKAGCFSSNAVFQARRAELVAEQQAINAANEAINRLIDNYNQKADTYNSSIVRSTELQDLINSNSSTMQFEE